MFPDVSQAWDSPTLRRRWTFLPRELCGVNWLRAPGPCPSLGPKWDLGHPGTDSRNGEFVHGRNMCFDCFDANDAG